MSAKRIFLVRFFRFSICLASAMLLLLVGTICGADETYMGDSSTITPDLFTGTFSYDFPIKVAPGRNGIEPKLVLNYRSSRGGYLGAITLMDKMELELGAIERSTMGSGVNYSADKYVFHRSNGYMALISAGGGSYRTVIEKEFLQIKKLTADDGKPYWRVTDKSGVRYTFGSTAASRMDDPSDPNKIFKWCLDQVEDANGNYMTVSYFKDQGQIYLDRIDYTGFRDPYAPQDSLEPTTYVKFNYDNYDIIHGGSGCFNDINPDFLTEFRITVDYRLKDITIKTGNDILGRGYIFDYGDRPYSTAYGDYVSVNMKLKNIQEFNNDRPDSIPPPPTSFVWENNGIKEIQNNIGGTTSLSHQNSTVYVWSNNGTAAYDTVQTLASVTHKDGNGNESTTTYDYSGGFHFIGTVDTIFVLEYEFRGFNHVTVTGPAGPDNKSLVTETWFHQGNDVAVGVNIPGVFGGYTKGLPYRIRISDSTGKKYSEKTISYKADAVMGAPYYTPPLQVDEKLYDGESNPRQTRTVYTYDQANGNLLREDRHGDLDVTTDDHTIIRTYSPNVTDWIVGLPASETTYQGIGTTTKVAETTYYYDDLENCQATPTSNQTPTKGNLTRVVRWNNLGAAVETRTGYNAYGNAVCTRDARGYSSAIAYDGSFSFPTSIINPLAQVTGIHYYGVDGTATDKGLYGQVKSVIDANNSATLLEYDGYGRKTRVTSPAGSWTSWSYLDLGVVGAQRVRTDTSIGEWQESYFDGLGRTFKTRRSGPDSQTIATNIYYDPRGAAWKIHMPHFEGEASYHTLLDSDPVGRTTKVTRADSSRELACYNAKLGVTVTIDGENHRKRETRDAFGRLTKVEEYTGTYTTCDTSVGTPYATTTYTYDVLGNLRYVYDANGNRTEMRYDSLGRKYWMRDLDMGDWSYGHDANGNLVSQTDAKQQTIGFVYDPLNRVTLKDYPSGTDVVFTYDETTSTNGIGRLTTMSDASGITKYFYDQSGRPTSIGRTIDGTTYSIGATYDGLDRINSVTYPDGETIGYFYDEGGNLQQVGTYAAYSGYNASGSPEALTFGNGTTTAYQYNPTNHRLNTITVTNPAQGGLLNLVYDYYNNGNVRTITDTLNGTRTQSFAYDELDRLTQAQGSYGTRAYTYNKIGNILTKAGVSYTYRTGGASSSDIFRPHAVRSTSNGRTFTYDNNGNMTSDGQRTFTFNYDNLTASINGDVNFVYDGAGNRAKKSSTFGNMVYIEKLYECRATDCAKYILAGNNLIAHKTSEQTYYYHTDHLGSTTLVTDASGNTAEEIAYYPFGTPSSETGAVRVSHLFTGQEIDGETGLYNYNARLYDADLGRFISADTIVPDPSNPQSLNRYSYVVNSPLNYIDPTGHFFFGFSFNWDFSGNWGGVHYQISSGNSGWDFDWNDIMGGYLLLSVYPSMSWGDENGLKNYSYGSSNLGMSAGLGGSNLGKSAALGGPPDVGNYFQRPQIMPALGSANNPYAPQTNLDAYAQNNAVNGIDPYGLYSIDNFIQDVANFSAGFGDTISFGLTDWIRDQMGTNYVVDKCSGVYTTGEVSGYAWDVAAGGAAVKSLSRYGARLAVHGPHHTFGRLGRLPHVQLNIWEKGVKGSGKAIRLPLPRR